MKNLINKLLCSFGIHNWKIVKKHGYENIDNRPMVRTDHKCRDVRKLKLITELYYE